MPTKIPVWINDNELFSDIFATIFCLATSLQLSFTSLIISRQLHSCCLLQTNCNRQFGFEPRTCRLRDVTIYFGIQIGVYEYNIRLEKLGEKSKFRKGQRRQPLQGR
jgi:hypothetical protein